jgi:hypothetical protein
MLKLGSVSESSCHAPSVREVIVLLIYVVLECLRLSCVVCGVGWDVDTSMFLRTVASPETLNG